METEGELYELSNQILKTVWKMESLLVPTHNSYVEKSSDSSCSQRLPKSIFTLLRKEKLPQICNLLFLFTDTGVVQSAANFVVDFLVWVIWMLLFHCRRLWVHVFGIMFLCLFGLPAQNKLLPFKTPGLKGEAKATVSFGSRNSRAATCAKPPLHLAVLLSWTGKEVAVIHHLGLPDEGFPVIHVSKSPGHH